VISAGSSFSKPQEQRAESAAQNKAKQIVPAVAIEILSFVIVVILYSKK
jgi:uncharacterized membrane protein